VEAFQALEAERKTLQTRTEELQAQRNQLSKQIGMLMGKGDKDAAEAAKAQVAASRSSWTIRRAPGADPGRTAGHAGGRAQPAARIVPWARRAATWKCAAGARPPFDFEVKDHVDVGTPLGWTSTWASSSRARASP
jgi:seryl-tRNA synthetase